MTRPLLSSVLPGIALVSALVAVAACSPKPSSDDIRIVGPAVQDFTSPCQSADGGAQTCGVSAMLERRCGSLDCHGYPRRPLRIYSRYGLRLPPVEADGGLEPGQGETTAEERFANYRAAIAVEPEQIDAVAHGNAEPNTLLLYKKPIGVEKHKGGIAFNKGDDSETCLLSWLKGTVDKVACGKAAETP